MFDYDRVIKRLGRFDDLPGRIKQEVLEDIFIDPGFREWFYQVGEGAKSQPMTTQMVNKLFTTLCIPSVFNGVIRFWKRYDSDKLDRTACCIGFMVVEQAIEQSNKASKEVSDGYQSGEISNRDAKTYKERNESYNDMISTMMETLKNRVRNEVKSIASKTNLPTGLIYAVYFMIPGRKYIPKFKISMFMNQILSEIYKWTGSCGMEDIEFIRWGPFFGSCFGNELVASAAVSILLEGVQRIDNYRDAENFDDVRSVWDSLTNFALTELNNAPEHLRRQMLELYLKRITKIFSNGRTPRLRVDILALPTDFSNLVNTVRRYSSKIHDITQSPNYVADNVPRSSSGMEEKDRDSRILDDDGDDADDYLRRDIREERKRREQEKRDCRDDRDSRRDRDRQEDGRRSKKSIFGNDPGRDEDDDPFFYDEDNDLDDDDDDDDRRIDDDDGDYYPPEDDEDEDDDPLNGIDY